jgi:N-acetylglucosamine kinase-like BadF-type ATPase
MAHNHLISLGFRRPGDLPRVLVIDAGATRTRAAVASVSGQVLGTGLAGPANSYAVGQLRSLESLGKAISQALKKSDSKASQIRTAVIGSAGVDYDESGAAPIAKSLKRNLPFARVLVKADALIALEGALAGDAGVVIVCGTGSIVLGKDSDGSIVKIGGWGPLMGDEGSAQWVGREALRRAALAADGTGPRTVLVQRLLRKYKLRSFDRIIDAVYKHPMTPAELGSLAPIVTSAAQEDHDRVARDIFCVGGEALASQAAQAAARLKLRQPKISYQGSMFNTGPLLLKPLRSRLHRVAPQARLMAPAFPPIAGAFLLALQTTRADHFESALEKFREGCDV